MQDQPTPVEFINAVAEFLRADVAPQLSGHAASGSLEELNRLLSARIASGAMDFQTPGLTEHVWQTTMDKLAIDQPNYASYRRERDGESG
jgi:hypothetical protein